MEGQPGSSGWPFFVSDLFADYGFDSPRTCHVSHLSLCVHDAFGFSMHSVRLPLVGICGLLLLTALLGCGSGTERGINQDLDRPKSTAR
jgi:hypothetical protein